MGMKKSNALGMMMMMGSLLGQQEYNFNEETVKRPLNKKQIKKIIPKGVKKFLYGEIVIYAINQKNADRKAKKKGLIV
jgi:tRNA U38,U39,U40 pseudouridine synthase TruA